MEPRRPYQEETVEFFRKHPLCACTTEAGLGKSRCAIDSWEDKDIILVVCPAHLKGNWLGQIKLWRPEILPQVTIFSYDHFARAKKKLVLPKFTTAVVDESTYIKSWDAKRTNVLCKMVLPYIPKVVFLSASPIQKSALDLHPTLSIIEGAACEDEDTFAYRFCNQVFDNYRGIKFVGVNQEHAAELRERWKKVSIKFTSDQVEKDLPPIVKDYMRFDSAKKPDYDPATVDYNIVTPAMKTEYQRMGMEKVPYVIDFIECSPKSEPMLVFAHHRRVVEELNAAILKMGRTCGAIVGGSTGEYKTDLVDKFQAGLLNYLVISMEAGGTGLNLPRAKRVLFAEIPWTYVTFYQCMKRAHRMNTQHPVYVHVFIIQGTLDDGLLRTVDVKKETSDSVIGKIESSITEGELDNGEIKKTKRGRPRKRPQAIRIGSETKTDNDTGNIGLTKGAGSLELLAGGSTSRESSRSSGGRDRGADNGYRSGESAEANGNNGRGIGRHSESASDFLDQLCAETSADAGRSRISIRPDDNDLGITAELDDLGIGIRIGNHSEYTAFDGIYTTFESFGAGKPTEEF